MRASCFSVLRCRWRVGQVGKSHGKSTSAISTPIRSPLSDRHGHRHYHNATHTHSPKTTTKSNNFPPLQSHSQRKMLFECKSRWIDSSPMGSDLTRDLHVISWPKSSTTISRYKKRRCFTTLVKSRSAFIVQTNLGKLKVKYHSTKLFSWKKFFQMKKVDVGLETFE